MQIVSWIIYIALSSNGLRHWFADYKTSLSDVSITGYVGSRPTGAQKNYKIYIIYTTVCFVCTQLLSVCILHSTPKRKAFLML